MIQQQLRRYDATAVTANAAGVVLDENKSGKK